MKTLALACSCILMVSLSNVNADEKDRAKKQRELDEACEAAREEKLAPLRQELIEECMEKQKSADKDYCTRFYSDYGARSGSRAPLFYDLPECVEAFEYQRSYRRREE